MFKCCLPCCGVQADSPAVDAASTSTSPPTEKRDYTPDVIYNSPPTKSTHQSPHLQDIIEEEKEGSDPNLDQLSLVSTYNNKYTYNKKRRNFFTAQSPSPTFSVKISGGKRKNKLRTRSVQSATSSTSSSTTESSSTVQIPASVIQSTLVSGGGSGGSAVVNTSGSPVPKMQAEQGSIGDLQKYHNRYLRNRRHTLANVR